MGWNTATIADVCEPTEQIDPRREIPGEFQYVDISGIDRTHKVIVEHQTMPGAQAPSRARKVIRKDDILVSTVRPNLNAVAMVPAHLNGHIASTGFCVLRSNNAVVEPRFLFYLTITRDFVAVLSERVRGANYPAVSDNDIKEIEIPLPPLSEQRRIVEDPRPSRPHSSPQNGGQRQSRANSPGALHQDVRRPRHEPDGWPIKRFDMICESRLGKMLDQKQQTGKDPRPYLRNANVYWDRIDLQEVLQMDFNDSDREEFRLRRGDILICEGGEVGRSAIWNDELPECYFQKALHRVRPYQNAATPEYIVFLLLRLANIGALRDTASKMTFSHLTGVRLKALQIPVPPFELQQEFSMQVQGTKEVLNLTGSNHDRISSLFIGILHRAFSGTLTAPAE